MIYDRPDGDAIKQALWGDHIWLTGAEAPVGWRAVRTRKYSGFARDESLSRERLLEIVFVDIGQGDGALVVTPDDKHLLVDAGEKDNLYRFLYWRYRFKKPFTFEAAVISHHDKDHYYGFKPIFEDPNIRFEALYHNGLVERAVGDLLGPDRDGFLTDVVQTRGQLEALLRSPAARADKLYPNLLHDLLASGRVSEARSMSFDNRHLPGFGPGETASGLGIEVLGPILDRGSDGAPLLRRFGGDNPTKNGHSIVLRIVYKNVSVLLGGDLNTPAENHLLSKHTGYPSPPDEADRDALLSGARKVFRSDVAKACHHGSADFTDLFLQAVDPIATVISSGDDEPHAHPRADSLGAVGRWGRGSRPLVFSTELARSAPDMMAHPEVFRSKLEAAQGAYAAAPEGPARSKAKVKIDRLLERIGRSVAVYGAINLRSDGKRIVMAQKVEKPKKPAASWDVYLLEPDANGVLRYQSKYDGPKH